MSVSGLHTRDDHCCLGRGEVVAFISLAHRISSQVCRCSSFTLIFYGANCQFHSLKLNVLDIGICQGMLLVTVSQFYVLCSEYDDDEWLPDDHDIDDDWAEWLPDDHLEDEEEGEDFAVGVVGGIYLF